MGTLSQLLYSVMHKQHLYLSLSLMHGPFTLITFFNYSNLGFYSFSICLLQQICRCLLYPLSKTVDTRFWRQTGYVLYDTDVRYLIDPLSSEYRHSIKRHRYGNPLSAFIYHIVICQNPRITQRQIDIPGYSPGLQDWRD